MKKLIKVLFCMLLVSVLCFNVSAASKNISLGSNGWYERYGGSMVSSSGSFSTLYTDGDTITFLISESSPYMSLTRSGSVISVSYSSSMTVDFGDLPSGSYSLSYSFTQKSYSNGYYTGSTCSRTVYIQNTNSSYSEPSGSGSSGSGYPDYSYPDYSYPDYDYSDDDYSGSYCSHTYTDNCDSYCNSCGDYRTAPHTYTNSCDSLCNDCYHQRSGASHSWSNSCDTSCNRCGATRNPSHYYLNDYCDEECYYCGQSRGYSHVFSDSCDSTCYYCDYTRAVTHTYDDSCDTVCNICYEERKAPHSYKTAKVTKATLKKNGKVIKKCKNCGVKKSSTVYYPKSIKLSYTSTTYNGKTKKPTVTVKDSKGRTISQKYYTVKYADGRKSIGKYTVTVTFKGKYEGTKKLSFTIKPAKVTLSSVTAGSKKLTATWKPISNVSGYEIQYSTSKKFTEKTTKKVTIKKSKSEKATIKKLAKGKKYYVKVRAYKTVDKVKIYGSWSKGKSVTIK